MEHGCTPQGASAAAPVTRRSLRRASGSVPESVTPPPFDAGPATRRERREAERDQERALGAVRTTGRLVVALQGPGRHSHPARSRHRSSAPSGVSRTAVCLGVVVLLVTGAIGSVHADLNARQRDAVVAALQVEGERRERIDLAAVERLTAQAEHYASTRRVLALDAAHAALQDAGAVVLVATTVLDPETVSPLDQAVADLAALIETVVPPTAPAPAAGPVERVAQAEAASSPAGDVVPLSSSPAAVVPQANPPADAPRPDQTAEAAPAPPDPLTAVDPGPDGLDLDVSDRMIELAARVVALTDQLRAEAEVAEAELAAAQAAVLQERAAQAVAAQQAAAELARRVAAADRAPNGAIPHEVLCGVGFESGVLLRCDAAAALEDLNDAFRAKFGTDLDVSSSYRDYRTQVAAKESRGALAAEPGTSNHGRGLAVDLNGFGDVAQFDRPFYRWMVANAGRYGWTHPSYMGPGGSGPLEPWHWEYGTR